jgi:hypothetical protein
MSLARSLLPFLLAACFSGCADLRPLPLAAPGPAPYTPTAAIPGAEQAVFVLPRGAEPPPFFDLPWPSELRRKPDGRLDLRGFPGSDTLIFGEYVDVAGEDALGYSVAGAVYFRFSGPLAAPALPADPRASASARSPVFLVDVDPASPERGTFVPLEHRWYAEATTFVPAGTLAVKPLAGFVLRPDTLYAAVVRRALGGAPLGTSFDLEIVKWTAPRADPAEERARSLHAPALDYLAELGVPRDDVAAIAIFRTQIPQAVTARMLDVATHLPRGSEPRILSAAWADRLAHPGEPASYLAIEGVYCTPNFQSGIERAPFLVDDGGRVGFEPGGAPRVVPIPPSSRYASPACGGLMRARFVLTVPARPMPPGGFPLMISAHGTGGDAGTFLGANDFAGWAAREGVAVVSTDQPLHGGQGRAPRPGSREPIAISLGGLPLVLSSREHAAEIAFYNPLHPGAARDNLRQAAIDAMVLLRLVLSSDLAPLLAADGVTTGRVAPRFDARRVLAAGHSQGSQSMAVLGAIDPLVRGVILSGAGGDARLGILRRSDIPLLPVMGTLLGLAPGELDELHPFMSLLQTLADPIDPGSYARFYWQPLPGHGMQSVLSYEGMTDTYAPPVTAEALAVALHATPLSPVLKPVTWLSSPETPMSDLLRRAGPVRAFAQFAATRGENGHFVIYVEPGAADLAMQFIARAVGPD